MLFIQHNMIAQNANRQLNVSTGKSKKTTEKLSSGYRINRAADDAAGLAISEKMRRQIRGLTQGTANAKDGVSYVQVADGAMDEGHAILQRMNELAIKSLNGTHTESDRAALNAEFDQLRTEIDRINSDTEFNEQKVFEEHEPSYYQIEGSIRWNDNQLHTVPAAANELKISLPDSYVPDEYIITVPAGVYTTQELVDEIDDALETMNPPNPGFVFEYTQKGYCNLNFENAEGLPTKIESVSGSLAYLIYDLYGGSSSGDLLGTSVFTTEDPFKIHKGHNDELGFYIESANGTEYIKMTIPAGEYTRAKMIDIINNELARHPNAVGVTAKEYGDSYIQITGGKGVSINGLKGNMFKYEPTTSIYSSVFYDNVLYGDSKGENAIITGEAYYYNYSSSPRTADINITAGVNDVLRFKLNTAADYTEVTIPPGKYTTLSLKNTLNTLFANMDIKADNSPSTSYPYRLVLSSTLYGSKSHLEFDKTPGSVYANTYDSLFRITNYLPSRSTGQNASISGLASHTGKITLSGNASLAFDIDGKTYTLSGIGGVYDKIGDLVTALNHKLAADYPDIKDKVKFSNSSSQIRIAAQNNDIKEIKPAEKNSTYKQLFEGTYVKGISYAREEGKIEYEQGSSATKKTNAELAVTIPPDKQSGPITIDKNSSTMSFYSNVGSTGTITLADRTYNNLQELASEINSKLKASSNNTLRNMEVSYNGGKLVFTSPPLADSYWLYLSNTSTSSAWANIIGVEQREPTPQKAGKTTLTTYEPVTENTTINNKNNKLVIHIGGKDVTVDIASGSYTSRDALKNAVQSAINGNPDLKGKVDVTIVDNKLQLSAGSSDMMTSGSFHDGVLVSKVVKDPAAANNRQDGSYSDSDYTEAFIIGRKDLTGEPVEIVADANDTFTFDFTYKSRSPIASSYEISMDIKIPAGRYTGSQLSAVLQGKIQEKFAEEGLDEFTIQVGIGLRETNVANSNDKTALQILVHKKKGVELDDGEYILDGIRGSAASFIFYKTTTEPRATYITGTKDLSAGITFQPGQNVLTLSADAKPYQYTLPTGVHYTAEEFAELLNDMFSKGDDYGNTAPLKASIENGILKITHKVIGSHSITDVGGSARNIIFYNEGGRDSRKPLTVLVSGEAGDHIEIPRVSMGSCAMKINSITISRPKYAEKAVRRIKEAINLLSSKRSTYGAMQNRLEHTIRINNNVIENTQASESAIRDADVADLMMEHSVNNILTQAGSSMLTQANQNNRLILELLR